MSDRLKKLFDERPHLPFVLPIVVFGIFLGLESYAPQAKSWLYPAKTLATGICLWLLRREYKNLSDLDVAAFGHAKVAYFKFSEEEQREIIFKDITTGEVTHTTILDTTGIIDYRSVIGYFTQTIMKDLRLVSGYDVLY